MPASTTAKSVLIATAAIIGLGTYPATAQEVVVSKRQVDLEASLSVQSLSTLVNTLMNQMGDVQGEIARIRNCGNAGMLYGPSHSRAVSPTLCVDSLVANDTADGDATIANNVNAQAFYYTSDGTLKGNVQRLNGADIIRQLDGVSFQWLDNGRASVGLVAQDVEKVLPQVVSTNPATGLKAVEYGALVAPLIEAVKSQQAMLEAQQATITTLEEDLAALKAQAAE